jgi:hypothetical protein
MVAVGAQKPHTPPPGSAERKAILDTLRAPVEKELDQKVVFKIDHFAVLGEWAFVRGVPQRPDGTAVDYSRSRYQEAIDEGVFDDWFCALLRKRGGEWNVVTYSIGATDVAWEPWSEEHGAPRAIFR